MNQFSLRFPAKLEEKYSEFTKPASLSHFKMYQPLLITITLIVSIAQLENQQIMNGVALGIAAVVFIVQIPIVCTTKDNSRICFVFVLNNIICTGLQLVVDNNQTHQNSQYVQACLITIVNITLLEHFDFIWNAATLTVIIAIRTVFIGLFLQFYAFAGLYVASSCYLYVIMYRKAQVARSLFLRYENEKEIKSVLDAYIQDIYMHFLFDSTTFKFELRHSNLLAQKRLGVINQSDLHDFLKNYQIYKADLHKYKDSRQHSMGSNQFQERNKNISKSLNLGQYLYEKVFGKQVDNKQKLELLIVNYQNEQIFKITCFTFTLLHQEIIMVMKYSDDVLPEDCKLQLKNKEIKLLQHQLEKINERTKKQLDSLSLLLDYSSFEESQQLNQKQIYSLIVSNIKTQMILDAVNVYYTKKQRDITFETVYLDDLINQSISSIKPIADISQKNMIFENNQRPMNITTQISVVKFIFEILLFIFLIQKEHHNIIIKICKVNDSGIIILNYYIDGLHSLEFMKQNTFILKMLYKGLNLVGPKAEIVALSDTADFQSTSSKHSIQLGLSFIQVKIYQNLEAILSCIV